VLSRVQFPHHHFYPRLKCIPPSPFSQSIYSLLSVVPLLSYYSLSMSSSISSAFYARAPSHVFSRVSSCMSLTVDISLGHRIRCLRIPCLDILKCIYTNIHVQAADRGVCVKRYLATVSSFKINECPNSVSQWYFGIKSERWRGVDVAFLSGMHSHEKYYSFIRANMSREEDITRFFHLEIRSPRNQITFQIQYLLIYIWILYKSYK